MINFCNDKTSTAKRNIYWEKVIILITLVGVVISILQERAEIG